MSYKKKQEIVASIEKDKSHLLILWEKSITHYANCRGTSNKTEKIIQNDLCRESRMLIMDVAMDNYQSKFFLHEERNMIIGETFSEFWDFLHWWLKDVGINPDD